MNEWGRVMPVDKDRVFTQAPALHGQSGTREIVCDGLLKLPIRILKMLVAQIHDEVIFSIPKKELEEVCDIIQRALETTFKPRRGGQSMEFVVSRGPAAKNWMEATH